MKVRNLYDSTGDVVIPITHERAVVDNNGISVAKKLSDINNKLNTQITRINKNLLHNWYYGNPESIIDTKRGYVIPPNVSYYTDDSLTISAGTTTVYTSANYINGVYGTIIVDGVRYFVDWSYAVRGYVNFGSVAIDCFRTKEHTSNVMLIESNGITIHKYANQVDGPAYYLCLMDSDSDTLVGKQVTLSALNSENELVSSTGVITNVDPFEDVISTTFLSGFKVKLVRGSSHFEGQLSVSLGFDDSVGASANSETIVAIKLEIGSEQTLAYRDSDNKWVLNDIPSALEQSTICSQFDPHSGLHMGASFNDTIRSMHIDENTGVVTNSVVTVDASSDLKSTVKLERDVDGVYESYNLYGEHNKPSIAELNGVDMYSLGTFDDNTMTLAQIIQNFFDKNIYWGRFRAAFLSDLPPDTIDWDHGIEFKQTAGYWFEVSAVSLNHRSFYRLYEAYDKVWKTEWREHVTLDSSGDSSVGILTTTKRAGEFPDCNSFTSEGRWFIINASNGPYDSVEGFIEVKYYNGDLFAPVAEWHQTKCVHQTFNSWGSVHAGTSSTYERFAIFRTNGNTDWEWGQWTEVITDATVPNENLLDNWYFTKPVNQRCGYMVLPSTPCYSDKECTNQVGVAPSYTMVDHVFNSYGTVVINASVLYVKSSDMVKGYCKYGLSAYTLDRWMLKGSYAYLMQESDGIMLGKSIDNGSEVEFKQFVSDCTKYLRRPMTLSVMTTYGAGELHIPYNWVTNQLYTTVIADTVWNIRFICNSNGIATVSLYCDESTTITSLKVYAIKLEVGNRQTLSTFDVITETWVVNNIPDERVQMAKCQTYQVQFNNKLSDYVRVGLGDGVTEKTAYVMLPIPTSMVSNPTVAYSGNWVLISGATRIPVTDIVFNQMSSTSLFVEVTVDSGITPGDMYWLGINNDKYASLIADSNIMS